MRTTASQRLIAALEANGIDPARARIIFNAVHAPEGKTRSMVSDDLSWAALQESIRRVERLTTSNRKKWPDVYRDLYEQYVTVLRKARDDIDAARAMLVRDPDNPTGPKVPATIKDIARLAAKRNEKTNTNGPTCTTAWQTWVSPDVRDALVAQFDAAYVRNKRKGAAPRPFLNTATRKRIEVALETHRAFIARQRSILCVPNARHPVASSPYGALHLCALRMAERALDDWERRHKTDAYLALNAPLPMNWMHLLTPEMRKRVIAADKNHRDVYVGDLGPYLLEANTEMAQPAGIDTSAPPDGQEDYDFDAEIAATPRGAFTSSPPPALMQPTPPADNPGEFED